MQLLCSVAILLQCDPLRSTTGNILRAAKCMSRKHKYCMSKLLTLLPTMRAQNQHTHTHTPDVTQMTPIRRRTQQHLAKLCCCPALLVEGTVTHFEPHAQDTHTHNFETEGISRRKLKLWLFTQARTCLTSSLCRTKTLTNSHAAMM